MSSIKELSRRWYPRAYFNAPKKTGGHRALADIRESIAELRYYREAVFVPQPGPDSDAAKAIAARYQVGPDAPDAGPTSVASHGAPQARAGVVRTAPGIGYDRRR